MTFLHRHAAECYAAMRVVAGFLFLWHGLGKIFGWPVPFPPEAPQAVRWIAGGIELVGGGLVMVGLATRPAAFLSSGLMAFAYWLGHGTRALLPVTNGGELAALYCFVFLFIAAEGGGRWSVDGRNRGA